MINTLMSTPYTYLIGWSKSNLWYYGVRYARDCEPGDLWVSYFTSSKKVKEYRAELGEPDVIQIRKTFNSGKLAKLWEDKVLARMNVRDDPKWVNQSNNYSFAAIDTSWNTGLTKETDSRLKNVSNKVSNKRKEKYWKTGTYNRSEEQIIGNRMYQLVKHNPLFPYKDYNTFAEYCNKQFSNNISIHDLSKELRVDNGTVKLAIKYITGSEPVVIQSWSKIKKRNPSIPFANYADLCKYIYTEIKINGRKTSHLRKELNISDDAIKRAIRVSTANHCL